MSITGRLTFLAHSVCMRPAAQELPWFVCDGFVKDELLIRFVKDELLIRFVKDELLIRFVLN